MKKKFFVVLLVLLMMLGVGITFIACENDSHTHTFASEWSWDETYHWHEATCEHKDEVNDKAEHNFVDNQCTVCGYKKDNDSDQDVYTVTFDSQGGSYVESVTVSKDSLIKQPQNPTKNFYVFDGWYKDKDCTERWWFDVDKVTSSITLYAKWAFLDNGHSIKSSEDFEFIDDTTLSYNNTIRHETQRFDLRNKFEVSNGAEWRAFGTPECLQPTEITSRTIDLIDGWNEVYILVENSTTYEQTVYTLKDASILLISSENHQWYSIAKQLIIAQKYDPEKQIILITTIKSFYSDKFKNVMDLSSQEKLLIVDEAHRFTQRDEELHTTFKYMLGLSATPVNGKNNAAGVDLVNFFGGQVFNLPIEEALERHFLVPYNYHPIFVSATEDEENRFNQISANMASCFHEGVLIDPERFVKYVRARLRVISMAENKISHIDEFIKQIPIKDHFIVYCGDGRLFDGQRDDEIRHIQFVKDRLYNLGIKSSQFTATESMDRRMELVDMFNNNEVRFLY